MNSLTTDFTENEQGFLNADGFRLDYKFWQGNQTTVLALHGFGGSSASYRRLAPYLVKNGIGLMSISLPFHGESKVTGSGLLDVTRFAPALVAQLQSLGLESAPVLAHSLGGRIAVAMGVLQPQFTRQLFLMATGGFYPPEDYMFRYLSVFPLKYLLQTDFFAGLITGFLIPGLQGDKKQSAIEALRNLSENYPGISLKESGILGRLYNYTGQTELIWGKNDNLVPASYAEEISQHFRHSNISVLENCGHLVMVEQPEALAQLITSKLANYA